MVLFFFHDQISTKEWAGHEDRTRDRLLTGLVRSASETFKSME